MPRAKPPLVSPTPGVATTLVRHAVAFYETDAMGVVHHSNYVRFLELARVAFLAEHDQRYEHYVAQGFHVPVTRVAVYYKRPCRFGDMIEVSCWLAWAQKASFGFAYRLETQGELVAAAETDHGVIDATGRPVRIPAHMRERMAGWLGEGSAPSE